MLEELEATKPGKLLERSESWAGEGSIEGTARVRPVSDFKGAQGGISPCPLQCKGIKRVTIHRGPETGLGLDHGILERL